MPPIRSTMIGEIRLWSGAAMRGMPRGWLPCDGSRYEISDYPSLYAIIQQTYGGTYSEFAVPDLRAHAQIGPGQGPKLKRTYRPGDVYGVDEVFQDIGNMPSHAHDSEIKLNYTVSLAAYSGAAKDASPSKNGSPASGQLKVGFSTTNYKQYIPADQSLSQTFISGLEFSVDNARLKDTGAANPKPIENRQPQITFGFFIAATELAGLFPPHKEATL